MDESRQHWLDRNRPPRVQITYDVETLGATVKQEIPFVVGVLGDFTGSTDPAAATTGTPLAQRRFVEIDRDNFDKVMTSLGATLDLSPDTAAGIAGKTLRQVGKSADAAQPVSYDVLSATDPITVGLNIRTLDDFSPRRILEQVGQAEGGQPLARMMQARQYLSELLVKIQGNVWSKDRVLPASVQALRNVSAQLKPVTDALGVFAAGGAPDKLDPAKFGDAAAAFTTAQDKVAPAVAAFTTAFGNVDPLAAPTAANLPLLTACSATLPDVRTAADGALTALQAGVAKVTDATAKAAATAAAGRVEAAVLRLDELIASARAVTDLAGKYFPPATSSTTTDPTTPAKKP